VEELESFCDLWFSEIAKSPALLLKQVKPNVVAWGKGEGNKMTKN